MSYGFGFYVTKKGDDCIVQDLNWVEGIMFANLLKETPDKAKEQSKFDAKDWDNTKAIKYKDVMTKLEPCDIIIFSDLDTEDIRPKSLEFFKTP